MYLYNGYDIPMNTSRKSLIVMISCRNLCNGLWCNGVTRHYFFTLSEVIMYLLKIGCDSLKLISVISYFIGFGSRSNTVSTNYVML